MKLAKRMNLLAAVCGALSIMTLAQASETTAQNSAKRLYGLKYGEPLKCEWQACSVDTDCLAIDDIPCSAPVAVNRDSAVTARQRLERLGKLADCDYAHHSTPLTAVCESNRCQLEGNVGPDFCLQRTRSINIINRCLAAEPELCPEASKRAEVWSLPPGNQAILEDACGRDQAQSCYELGITRINDSEIRALLWRACELRYAPGCFQLGSRFAPDRPYNSWFHTACDIDTSVCALIGHRLAGEKRASARSYWFTRGCDRGHGPACEALENSQKGVQALKERQDRAQERKGPVSPLASKALWDKFVADRPEMKGATLLGVERSKPGYTLSDFFIVIYSTSDGEVKRAALPAE